MPLCVCYSCGGKMDCDPSGVCEVCEDYREDSDTPRVFPTGEAKKSFEALVNPQPLQLGDRQTLNILQRLHQNILREDTPYVKSTNDCRWEYSDGVYRCEHVTVKEEDVVDMYKRQMEK